MERGKNFKAIKALFGENFIGPDELYSINERIKLNIPRHFPDLPVLHEKVRSEPHNFIIILGIPYTQNNEPVNIITLRNIFGIDSTISEPCFYNQDWYLKEDFVNKSIEFKWYILRKYLIEETKGKDPEIISKTLTFPTAILCTYTFFIYSLAFKKYLWPTEFIWCSDTDHNNDRIYVGRYFDPSGINKNGFNIHRHLKIRKIYGSIEQTL